MGEVSHSSRCLNSIVVKRGGGVPSCGCLGCRSCRVFVRMTSFSFTYRRRANFDRC